MQRKNNEAGLDFSVVLRGGTAEMKQDTCARRLLDVCFLDAASMPPAPPVISKLPSGSFFVGYAELSGEWVPFSCVSRKIHAMSLSPYLDKKAARLQHELQSLEHTQQLSEQGKTHLPVARAKLEEITAGYRGIIQAKKQRVLKAAQQEAQEKANLRSLDQDPEFSKRQAYTVMALVLGFALMFMLTGIFLLEGGMAWAVAIEREGADKPVCVAESLVRQYP